jgi:hypothetical protein
MYARGQQFIADYYDANGKRQRVGFPTREQAVAHENEQRTRAARTKLKNCLAAEQSPTSCGQSSGNATPPTPKKSRPVASSQRRARSTRKPSRNAKSSRRSRRSAARATR